MFKITPRYQINKIFKKKKSCKYILFSIGINIYNLKTIIILHKVLNKSYIVNQILKAMISTV